MRTIILNHKESALLKSCSSWEFGSVSPANHHLCWGPTLKTMESRAISPKNHYISMNLPRWQIYIYIYIHIFIDIHTWTYIKKAFMSNILCIWGFPSMEVPPNGWCLMENSLKWMIWGYLYFRNPQFFTNNNWHYATYRHQHWPLLSEEARPEALSMPQLAWRHHLVGIPNLSRRTSVTRNHQDWSIYHWVYPQM